MVANVDSVGARRIAGFRNYVLNDGVASIGRRLVVAAKLRIDATRLMAGPPIPRDH